MANIELGTYLSGVSERYHECIEACVACLIACEMCSDACLDEKDVTMMTKCNARRRAAMGKAVSSEALVAQPTTRRQARSSTTARYNQH